MPGKTCLTTSLWPTLSKTFFNDMLTGEDDTKTFNLLTSMEQKQTYTNGKHNWPFGIGSSRHLTLLIDGNQNLIDALDTTGIGLIKSKSLDDLELCRKEKFTRHTEMEMHLAYQGLCLRLELLSQIYHMVLQNSTIFISNLCGYKMIS